MVSRRQLSSVVRSSKYSFGDASSNLVLHFCEIPDRASAALYPQVLPKIRPFFGEKIHIELSILVLWREEGQSHIFLMDLLILVCLQNHHEFIMYHKHTLRHIYQVILLVKIFHNNFMQIIHEASHTHRVE